jgi:hypothetical protein
MMMMMWSDTILTELDDRGSIPGRGK